MKKKNRRIKKHVVFTVGTGSIVSLILTGFTVLLVYWWLDQRCTTIGRQIGKAERELKSCESELGRENTKWVEMTTPEKLVERLVRSGIEMRIQRQDQIIRMDASGRPLPGLAVARANLRKTQTATTVASVKPAKRASAATRVRR